jgi:hypothetical protein
MKAEELAKIIEETAIDRDGAKQLPCAVAFELVENYCVTLMEIGESCNRLGIKIVGCQLGCFE